MVFGSKKSIFFSCTFINSICFVCLNLVQNNPFPFQVFFYSLRSSPLLRHHHLWLNIFAAGGASSGSRDVFSSKISFLLTRDFSFVSSSLLLPNTLPPLSYIKKLSSSTFGFSIVMVAVRGSHGETVEFPRAEGGLLWVLRRGGGASTMYYSSLGSLHSSSGSQKDLFPSSKTQVSRGLKGVSSSSLDRYKRSSPGVLSVRSSIVVCKGGCLLQENLSLLPHHVKKLLK